MTRGMNGMRAGVNITLVTRESSSKLVVANMSARTDIPVRVHGTMSADKVIALRVCRMSARLGDRSPLLRAIGFRAIR
jgi:hypothetical protein